ncbi:class E sortase [Streptomyces monashensis]|uniref:Class E sortase n=1 Tax=Streptomyces monashensis TaxID=1678012 RepID=A0A1S2QJC4_9ACTN|nr:class E sortase [Streptomyces monashensis]OIK05747.1 class E sortase [Streptomyces monashensis]
MRVIVRTFSELCITIGALIVLFVAYILFWTGVRADGAMSDQIDQLHRQWSKGSVQPATRTSRDGTTTTRVTVSGPAPYHYGRPFAIMYIPRFGFTWNKPVAEGTGRDVLAKGLAHYQGTAQLGQEGNFAVAGHRRTYGDPFLDFPKLRPGDAVVLTDGTTWFTYRIDKGPYKTVPTDVEVIDPVPRTSGYTRPGRYLTLTTCDPEWGHSHRLIVWAHLDSTRSVEAGEPAALRR